MLLSAIAAAAIAIAIAAVVAGAVAFGCLCCHRLHVLASLFLCCRY
jgi:hypothetical protein